jgi:serine/threonine protein kinase/AAA+ superfamily predicted ATPase
MAGRLQPGDRLGAYTLTQYLGAGAFKSVYQARNDGGPGEETVALGIPHRQEAEDVEELRKEFAVTSRLRHPCILRMHALDEYNGLTFLVMRHVEGRPLRELLKERERLPAAEALRYVGMLSEALAYAHDAHVFHRDVKPDNVTILPDGTPVLLDFGVARLLTRTGDQASTRAGTVEYMAPEVFQSGAAGVNADIWALGITLYELLTGERPFTGSPAEVINKVLHAPVDEGPLRRHGVDPRITRVLRKMLQKDPELRYQSADDLASDLEAVARRTRLTDDDESRLEILIRASFPLINVLTFEEGRALASIRAIADRLAEERKKPRPVLVWSASRGLRGPDDKLLHPDTLGDPTTALVHAIESPDDAVYVFLDMHRQYSPVTTRLIRDTARAVRASRKSMLFISPTFQAPEELRGEMTLAVFQLPDRQQLAPVLAEAISELEAAGYPVDLADDARLALERALLGMTVSEARRAIRTAALAGRGLSAGAERVIAEQKRQIIRKSGILEYYHTSESFGDVGGLENLLDWFRMRKPIFAEQARYAGLPVPRGVLLVGVPGCGKSLSARALAGEWGTPLVRLDVGRIFGSIVGEAETNMRRAIQTAEAVSPCILWIDEVEKGFAGSTSQSGGGVGARVFGTFLTWLQEKKSAVFVVATANDLTGIPPEFLRQGRFDEIFFVGLPDAPEREAMFRIHLAKRRRDPAAFNVPALAAATHAFSGAEIEQVVLTGLFHAFTAGRELTDEDLATAATEVYPLARSQPRRIGDLVAWGRQHARQANARSAEVATGGRA